VSTTAPMPEVKSTIVEYLDNQIVEVMSDIHASEVWKCMNDPATPKETIHGIMREINLEIYWYQADVIEATIWIIGQMPRTVLPKRLQSMLIHQADEFDHGEMALRDYVALGGDEHYARTSRMSPAAFATASYWWGLAHQRDPFAYLGGLYMFEGLTPLVAQAMLPVLKDSGMADSSLEYAIFHATEDVKHANLVRFLLAEIAESHPESVEAMKHGIACFRHVYPIPVWEGAYRRVMAAMNA